MSNKQHALLAAIFAVVITFAASAFGDQAAEQAAEKAAESWLTLVDSSNYGASWDQAASVFKARVNREQWEKAARIVRAPLGKLKSRTLSSAKYTRQLPGVPDGQYVVIQYDTSFENKNSAVETITPMLDKDGKWKVAGYFIR